MATAGYSNVLSISTDDSTYNALGGIKSFSSPFSADELDTTAFGTGQWRTSIQGLKRLTGDMEILSLPATDLDPGAGSRKISDLFTNGTQVVFTIAPGAIESHRFIGTLFSLDTTAAVDALITTSVPFMSQAVVAADGTLINVAIF